MLMIRSIILVKMFSEGWSWDIVIPTAPKLMHGDHD